MVVIQPSAVMDSHTIIVGGFFFKKAAASLHDLNAPTLHLDYNGRSHFEYESGLR